MILIDFESDDYLFNKTLHNDIQLKPEIHNDKWDMQFDNGDIVNLTGKDSLKNAICLAIMTRLNELSCPTYTNFGSEIHKLVKKNKSNMTRKSIEYYCTDVLEQFRRIKTINEINVTTKNSENSYDIFFNVTSINDEIITGELKV